MTCERRQFACVAAFIQGEEDDRKVRLIAEPVEQGLQCVDVVGSRRDVRSLVSPEVFEQPAIVVAETARVDLHHEPVIEAHGSHFGQHLAAKQLCILRRCIARFHPVEQRRSLRSGKVGCRRGRMPVIGGCCPHFGKECAALAMGSQVARPALRIFAGQLCECGEVLRETFEIGIDNRVRAVSCDNPAVPSAFADRLVMRERVDRAFGRREDLQPIAIEQCARTERVCLQRLCDRVEIEISG